MFRLQLVEEFNQWKEKRSFLQRLTEDICLNHIYSEESQQVGVSYQKHFNTPLI